MLALFLLGLVAASVVYCVLIVIAAENYCATRPLEVEALPPFSILKPLSGGGFELEERLRSFFEQKYPRFEILFAVRAPNDPAIPVVEKLCAAFPATPSRVIFTGDPPYPNAKVFSLERLFAAARYDLVVTADDDVHAEPNLLATFAAEFQDPMAGLLTCPYRSVPSSGFWSKLETVGLNTGFLAEVLVARLFDRLHFALGATIAARRQTLADLGGFHVLKDYLAEDYAIGKLAAELGWRVILSSGIVERHIGPGSFVSTLQAGMRRNRAARRSRPYGYILRIFTNPLPLALLFCIAVPDWWPVLLVTAVFRALAARATASRVLGDPLTRAAWWLVPLQDATAFLLWLAAFFGNTIRSGGRRYHLLRDGRLRAAG